MSNACVFRTAPAYFIEASGGRPNPDKLPFLASKQVERRSHVVGDRLFNAWPCVLVVMGVRENFLWTSRGSWLEKVHSSSERETVAAQTKESGVTITRGACGGKQLMQRVNTAMLTTLGAVLMFHGNAGARRFDNVQWRAVAAEHFHRRPFRQHRD